MPDFEDPKSRIEACLQNILGAENVLPDPVSRNEKILHAILGEEVELGEPQSRIEKCLMNWNGSSYELEDPISNNERILHNIIGDEVEILPIQSRVEALLLKILQEGGGEDVDLLRQVSPITLVNALAKPLKKFLQYGLCIQASTPAPTAPVAIKCNNGTIAYADTELPLGYKRVIGFTFSSNCYFKIPNFRLTGSDTVYLSFSVTKACNVFGCYTTTSADDNYSLYMSTTSGSKYLRYNGSAYNSYIASSHFGERYDAVITPTGSTGMPNNDTWEQQTFESSVDMCIGTTSPSATSSKLDGNIWGDFVVEGRFDGIPCERVSDHVLGYYDTYSGTFYEPETGSVTSLGYDTSHVNLCTKGTPEEIWLDQQYAWVVDLFGIDDDGDIQDIITGIITRKYGVKVLTGEETIVNQGGKPNLYGLGSKKGTKLLCTHFAYTTEATSSMSDNTVKSGANEGNVVFRCDSIGGASALKTWFAEQYASGNPVIMIYEKATATEEEVDPQPLSTEQGDNTITVTAEISGIEFDVTYVKAK